MEESNKPGEQDILSDYYTGYQELELQAAQAQVKKARNALFVVAAITLVYNLIAINYNEPYVNVQLIFVFVVSLVFAGLALLTAKQPFIAILIGLILYLALWILDIVVLGVENLIRGILVRGIIIYFLVVGIKHAREAERLRKAMRKPDA